MTMKSVLNEKMTALLNTVNSKETDESKLDTLYKERCERALGNIKSTHEGILEDGILTQRLTTRWEKKDGLTKSSDKMKANGYRADKGYLVQCVITLWYALRGVDIFTIGNEKRRRKMFTLVKMGEDGKINFVKTKGMKADKVKETLESILEGKHTHKDENDNIVTTQLADLTGTLFDETFKAKKKSRGVKLNWSIKRLEGKEDKIESVVREWFKEALKVGVSKDDEDYDTYNNPIALKIAQVLASMVIPTAPLPTDKIADKAEKALQEA